MDEQSNGRHDADLAAIKAREDAVRDAIRRGEPSVDLSGGRLAMTRQQLGLRDVVADRWGRMWRVDAEALTLISGPRRVLR